MRPSSLISPHPPLYPFILCRERGSETRPRPFGSLPHPCPMGSSQGLVGPWQAGWPSPHCPWCFCGSSRRPPTQDPSSRPGSGASLPPKLLPSLPFQAGHVEPPPDEDAVTPAWWGAPAGPMASGTWTAVARPVPARCQSGKGGQQRPWWA